jgi:hypothetical protein
VIVTVVPLTVHPAAITVVLCTVATQTGVVYVVPSVIVQLVLEDIEHVPPKLFAACWSMVLEVIIPESDTFKNVPVPEEATTFEAVTFPLNVPAPALVTLNSLVEPPELNKLIR